MRSSNKSGTVAAFCNSPTLFYADIPCIRVITMKKTEFISFRTDKETKEELKKIAESKKWSISLLVEEIVQEWMEKRSEQAPDSE